MTCHAQECLINHVLLPKYAQKFLKQGKKEAISNLIRFFHFFNFRFLVKSHYPDHPLLKQTFFVKKKLILFFYHFQHGIYFSINPFLFQICHFLFQNIFF